MKKTISTQNAPAAIGPYSQAVEWNGMIFSSGISTGTIVALVLNLVLKETQVSAEKLKKVEVA